MGQVPTLLAVVFVLGRLLHAGAFFLDMGMQCRFFGMIMTLFGISGLGFLLAGRGVMDLLAL